ncbi:hypothetical protein DXT99_17170 [Pontibacter diazotrophicus]|uniref:Uncharacterized protein n=1 Tax=Pontibacter diazotrophicus TaxID=1400979 RepID=A0A3D8L9I2_9BACT|nr:hypothetical protein DXT99_17170 [Pontibacter diazotrophicus]
MLIVVLCLSIRGDSLSSGIRPTVSLFLSELSRPRGLVLGEGAHFKGIALRVFLRQGAAAHAAPKNLQIEGLYPQALNPKTVNSFTPCGKHWKFVYR